MLRMRCVLKDYITPSLSLTLCCQRKFNVPVTVTLLRSGLVSVLQEDQQLAKFLYTDPRPSLLIFAAELIRECLSSDPQIATQSQFAYTLEILNQLTQAGKVNDESV